MREDKFSHAIIIMCHKVTESLKNTIDQVENSDDTVVYIHVDKKASLKDFTFLENYKRSYLFKDRKCIRWGDFSQIDCMIDSLSYVTSQGKYTYISLISGEDFIYRGLFNFNNFLKLNNGKEFIAINNLEGVDNKIKERYLYRYPEVFFNKSKNISVRLTRKVILLCHRFGLLKNILDIPFDTMYKGSNWFTITGSCAQFVVDYCKDNKNYIHYFEKSFCCDEVFFQSLIFNSPFGNKTLSFLAHSNDDNKCSLREIDWITGPDFPKVFKIEDVRLINQRDTFILRKLDPSVKQSQINDYMRDNGIEY